MIIAGIMAIGVLLLSKDGYYNPSFCTSTSTVSPW
jgi:hypothetical protein